MRLYQLDKSILKEVIILAGPAFLAFFAQFSMTFVDSIIAGHYNSVDMAAIALANSFFAPVTLFGSGLLMVLTPLVAQAKGSKNIPETKELLKCGMCLTLILSLFVMLVLTLFSIFLRSWSSIDPAMGQKSSQYLFALVFGIPGMLFYGVQRFFLEGLGNTKPAMYAGYLGLVLHIPLDIILIFGKFGMPELGAVGCGIATSFIYTAMGFCLIFFVYSHTGKFIHVGKVSWNSVITIFKIGFPGALAQLIEMFAYSIVAIIIAPLGVVAVASQQIAGNIEFLLYLLPSSFGVACSIFVGTYIGAENFAAARRVRKNILYLGVIFGIFLAMCLYFFRSYAVLIYTEDSVVAEYSLQLLALCALYQIIDEFLTNTMFALRGWNDTKFIFLTMLVSYIIIALPLGYVLSMTDWLTPLPLEVAGFWIAQIIGICFGAVMMLLRVNTLERNPEKYKYLYKKY